MDDDDYLSEGSDDDEPRGKKSKGKGGSSSPSGKKSPVPKVDRPQRKRKLTDKLKDALKSNDDEEDGPASGSDDERFEKKRRVGSRGRPKAEGVQKTPRKSDQEMKEPKQKKEKLYCTCKKPWRPDDPDPMIQCDTCNEWYHFKCVGLQFREEDAQQLEAATYECDTCAEARLNRENAQNGMPIQDAGVMQGVPVPQQQIAISYGNCKQCGATVVITDASEPCCLCKNQSRDYCQNCFAMQECVQCSKVACSLCRQNQKPWSAKCSGSNDCASRFCEDCQRQDSKGEYKCVGCGNCQCDDSSQHQLLSKCSVQGCNQVACPNCAAKVFTATATGQPLCAAHKDAAGAGGSAPQVQPPVQQPEAVSAAPVESQQQQPPAANGAPPS